MDHFHRAVLAFANGDMLAANRSVARLNYEQPIADWVRLLGESGFEHIVTRPIYPYWWAAAFLMDAR